MRVDTSSTDDVTSYKCIDDAKKVCFTGEPLKVKLEILGVDGLTYLAEKLTFEEGWVSRETIVW